MQRWVLHIDMDAFFASVEQLTRPTLQGRPVLVGGTSGRGVVAGASYEAREYGAHSAMPMYRAQQLVGLRAVVVQPRRAVYSAASRRVFGIIAQHVEVIEQLSIDEAFMEPAALEGASAEEVKRWADELRALIREETGLPCSIGAGSGKQFAKIGSGEAKPDGTFVIPAERQLDMLHPLAGETHKSPNHVGFPGITDGKYPRGDLTRVMPGDVSVHASAETRRYLATIPGRFEFVSAPRHGSWLNLVEGLLSRMARRTPRGLRVFSKDELKERILRFDEVAYQLKVILG